MKFANFKVDDFFIQNEISWRCHDSKGHIEYAINCPSCHLRGEPTKDTKKKLWVNFEQGSFYCYRCSWTGGIPKLVQGLIGCSWGKVIKLLRGSVLDQLEFMNLPLHNQAFVPFGEEDDLHEIDLPHGYEPIEGPVDYLEYRGIPWEYARDNLWGISKVGFTKDRIIVPTFMNGKIVFWQARSTIESTDKDFKKVLNPSGVSARSVLYNYDTAKEYETIYLVEGFIDCVKAGPDSMATNGKNLHAQQVEWLKQTKAKTIVIMWDEDAWTDSKETKTKFKPCSLQKAVDLLKSYSFDVKAVRIPKPYDPGMFTYGSKKLQIFKAKAKTPNFAIPKGKTSF